jgi:hypothetical protein
VRYALVSDIHANLPALEAVFSDVSVHALLTATGLSFLRNDAILLPVIGIAVAIALFGFWKGSVLHPRRPTSGSVPSRYCFLQCGMRDSSAGATHQ